MKTTMRLVAIMLLAVMVLSLVACSSFEGIKENFEKNGYEYLDDLSSDSTAKTITGELQRGGISCTAHLFKVKISEIPLLGTDINEYALVLEFDSDEDMEAAILNSATIKGFVTDIQNSELVNKNCMLIPLGLTEASNMIKIFNGEVLDK